MISYSQNRILLYPTSGQVSISCPELFQPVASINGLKLKVCYHHILGLFIAGAGIETIYCLSKIAHPIIHMKSLTITVRDKSILFRRCGKHIIRSRRQSFQCKAPVILLESYRLTCGRPLHNKGYFLNIICYCVAMNITRVTRTW